MKKFKIIFLFSIVAVFFNTSFAQFYLGVGVGTGSSNAGKSEWPMDAKAALSAGYLFYAKDDSAKREGFLLEFGVEYANRGLLFTDVNNTSRNDFAYIELNSRANFIKVPILFGVEGIFTNSKARYNIFLGFYYSNGLKSSGTLEGFSVNEDIKMDLDNIFKDKPTFTEYEYKPLKSHNVGLRAGVALIFSFNLFLKFNVDADFIKLQKQLKEPAAYVDLTLGYRFKFKG